MGGKKERRKKEDYKRFNGAVSNSEVGKLPVCIFSLVTDNSE
jgi:hypothetical protein